MLSHSRVAHRVDSSDDGFYKIVEKDQSMAKVGTRLHFIRFYLQELYDISVYSGRVKLNVYYGKAGKHSCVVILRQHVKA